MPFVTLHEIIEENLDTISTNLTTVLNSTIKKLQKELKLEYPDDLLVLTNKVIVLKSKLIVIHNVQHDLDDVRNNKVSYGLDFVKNKLVTQQKAEIKRLISQNLSDIDTVRIKSVIEIMDKIIALF